ncbi:hypothetical protein ACK3SF_05065 [Candidatus Nanosalina sp. VS9-1]|uniref:hypothetical protein n=1 Tax=Candidatus Nanosalina sp. VS9-1 TaxID=3388566 RepID=UPI0039E1D658
MRKTILLAFLILVLLTAVSAQSLQNFEYSPEQDFERSLTGGESFNQTINFTSEADRDLPFGLRVTVENESTNFETGESLGAEFDLTGSLEDSGSVRDLSFKKRLTEGNLIYVGGIDTEDENLSAESENSLEIKVEADRRISPDSFEFEFDVRSNPGFAAETNSSDVGADNSAEVKVGSSSVSVQTSSGKNVTVERYEETTVSPPENRNFVGGVGIEVKDDNGDDAEANGTVSIGYSQQTINQNNLDEDSMSVYFFNETSQEWTKDGVTVVNRDTASNVVEASVSHFSTYAAFAPEEDASSESSDGGSGWIEFDPQQASESTTESENDTSETEENTSERSDEQDSEASDREEPENITDNELEGNDEAQDDMQQERPRNRLTGFFSSQPSEVAVPVIAVILAALMYVYRKSLIARYRSMK